MGDLDIQSHCGQLYMTVDIPAEAKAIVGQLDSAICLPQTVGETLHYCQKQH